MSENTACVVCGGTVAPDGRCWPCGAVQPAFRSHLEISADNGAAGVSDRGKRREINADAMALATADGWTIGVVCDGVSMSPRAERAAQVAAEVGRAELVARLRAGALPEVALAAAAVRAGRSVVALATSVNAAPACTYVAGIAGPEGMWSAWIGDSRAYWLPDEGPGMALSEDDTGQHGALTAWLGSDADQPSPGIRSYRPPGPGRLLLYTDGLWRCLPDADGPRSVLDRDRHTTPGHGGLLDEAQALVDHALAAGGHDSALLIPVPARRPRPLRRQAVIGAGLPVLRSPGHEESG